MALHHHSPAEREEMLSALTQTLRRLEGDEEETDSNLRPAAEKGGSRQARSTAPQPPSSTGRTTLPFQSRRRYPFEEQEPPFAPQGVTEFLNTQFDRVLR